MRQLCKLGFHSWVPLGVELDLALCRHCGVHSGPLEQEEPTAVASSVQQDQEEDG
jgi:hypothetical protein